MEFITEYFNAAIEWIKNFNLREFMDSLTMWGQVMIILFSMLVAKLTRSDEDNF